MDIGGIEVIETGSRLLMAEDVAELTEYIEQLESENAMLREHVRMPDEPLEIDDKDFYTRAFIKWCVETKPCLDRLEAENVKLRKQYEAVIADYRSEVAKLRELVKQMHICLTRPKVYDGEQPYLTATECPYFTEGACDYNACGFELRMRELGIEVSDG
jgi:hypothetical protein